MKIPNSESVLVCTQAAADGLWQQRTGLAPVTRCRGVPAADLLALIVKPAAPLGGGLAMRIVSAVIYGAYVLTPGPSPARPAKTRSAAGTKTTKPTAAPQTECSVSTRSAEPREAEATETTAPAPPTPPAWSKVIGRKAKAKTAKSTKPKAPNSACAPAKATPAKRKGKLSPPKSSAVVITLRPEVVATQTYATVMKTATAG
ncbi:jg9852, partial [Pararge aegeria aegeria]